MISKGEAGRSAWGRAIVFLKNASPLFLHEFSCRVRKSFLDNSKEFALYSWGKTKFDGRNIKSDLNLLGIPGGGVV